MLGDAGTRGQAYRVCSGGFQSAGTSGAEPVRGRRDLVGGVAGPFIARGPSRRGVDGSGAAQSRGIDCRDRRASLLHGGHPRHRQDRTTGLRALRAGRVFAIHPCACSLDRRACNRRASAARDRDSSSGKAGRVRRRRESPGERQGWRIPDCPRASSRTRTVLERTRQRRNRSCARAGPHPRVAGASCRSRTNVAPGACRARSSRPGECGPPAVGRTRRARRRAKGQPRARRVDAGLGASRGAR